MFWGEWISLCRFHEHVSNTLPNHEREFLFYGHVFVRDFVATLVTHFAQFARRQSFEAFRASSPRMCIWQSTLALLPLSLPRLVWLNFCLPFSLSRTKEVFYASPRICSSFQNREEPLAHFEKRFCLFPALQKVMMVLKALLNDIVENFVTIWR